MFRMQSKRGGDMGKVVFNCEEFKSLFPEFEDVECSRIASSWNFAKLFFPIGQCLNATLRNLLAAHFLKLDWLEANQGDGLGDGGNVVASAQAGDTSVRYTNVDFKSSDDDFTTLLKKTSYGLKFLAALNRPNLSLGLSVASVNICNEVL